VLTDEREATAVATVREQVNALSRISATQDMPPIVLIHGGLASKRRHERRSW